MKSIDFLERALLPCTSDCESECLWAKIYAEYEVWWGALRDVALPFVTRHDEPAEGAVASRVLPRFGTPEWWACMIFLKVRNLDLVVSRVKHVAYQQPQKAERLPRDHAAAHGGGVEADGVGEGIASDDEDGGRLPSEAGSCCSSGHRAEGAEEPDPRSRDSFPATSSQCCSVLEYMRFHDHPKPLSWSSEKKTTLGSVGLIPFHSTRPTTPQFQVLKNLVT